MHVVRCITIIDINIAYVCCIVVSPEQVNVITRVVQILQSTRTPTRYSVQTAKFLNAVWRINIGRYASECYRETVDSVDMRNFLHGSNILVVCNFGNVFFALSCVRVYPMGAHESSDADLRRSLVDQE